MNWRLRFEQWAVDKWLFDFLAWALSAVAMSGIVITLLLHADRPLPSWPFSITVNALISVLATISTSALLVPVTGTIGQRKWHWLSSGNHRLSDLELYDEASRGPWGSLLLLVQIRINSARDIASLGALITILSLAIGPFIQQITFIESSPYDVDNSSLPYRLMYQSGLDNVEAHPQVTDLMRAAINQGLYFTGNLSDDIARNTLQPRPQCQTGNCSYGTFESLAVCSQCADISELLPPFEHKDTQDVSELWCNPRCYRSTLPNGFSTGWLTGSGAETTLTTSAAYDPIKLKAGLPILNLTAISPPSFVSGDSTQGGSAQECMLYWCVNKYKSSVANDILHEEVLETTKDGTNGTGLQYKFHPPGSNASFFVNETYLVYYGNISTGWINSTFIAHRGATDLISYYMNSVFSGITTLNEQNGDNDTQINQAVQRLYSASPASQGGKLDLSSVFEAMALSMTSAVRNNYTGAYATDGFQVATGPATALQPYLRVRWGWIALPAVLQIATLVLLCHIVVSTWRNRWGVWKSSALAMLFYGVELHDEVEKEVPKRTVEMRMLGQDLHITNDMRPFKPRETKL
ncbi:hypothetical protein F4779DRAFT_626726 [Xylariaceae sp. FL0662B]|nr:hypothetical protein F4779DRAFT_626726 [Xylariaceae sp. FL0662B]